MTPRDYKQRPAAKPSRTKARPASPWRWFGFGVFVGALITVAVFVYEPRVSVPGLLSAGGSVKDKAAATAPRFEFYTVLPEKEIAVPDSALAEQPRQPQAPVQAPGAATRYLLQAGSFRKLGDADRLKAQLAFMGLEATIQTVSIDGEETWHRVRLGPYGSLGKLKAVRSRLQKNRLEPIVLKLRN